MNAPLICRILLCSLLWSCVSNSFAQKFKPKYLRENDKTLLQFTTQATDDGWLDFKSDGEPIDAAAFSSKFAKNIGLQEGYQLRLVRDKTDLKETRHQHFQLYYKNILVEGAHLDQHSRKGVMQSAHVRIIDNLDISVDKPIDESRALATALADRKLTKELLRGKIQPKGQLVLTSIDGDYIKESYRLAYAFDLYSEKFTDANRVYIDASSGTVLKQLPLVQNCFGSSELSKSFGSLINPDLNSERAKALLQTATFTSLYGRSNPTPSFEVEPASGGGYQLSMSTTNVPQALDTRWDDNNDGYFNDLPLTNSSLNWGTHVQQASLAHWTAWQAHKYFQNKFGMNGTNGQGSLARILIVPLYQDNASWDNGSMYIGSHNGNILSSVDIVAHEYGHGVSNHLVGGWTPANAQSETRALNEGFSDIIATTIERELYPTGSTNQIWNYQIGEDVWLLRNPADPHSVLNFNVNPIKSYPQTYQESGFWDNNGEPHHNSTVISKWFHTLTTGSGPNGNNTASLNFDVAMQIVYWGLDNYIYGDYNYPNTAQALRAAAGSLFGQCSPEQNAVIAALNAVNLSVGQCTPDCNYAAVNISPASVNCNQGITLSANCTGATANNNVWTCQNVTYSFSGPNVPYNASTSTSINVTAPGNAGNYQYSLTLSKPNSGCYARTYNFNVSVNCAGGNNCDFSNGPRYVGTWNGLIVQIRQISGRNVLVTAIPNSPTDKYYPRGDNFWGNFTPDPGAVGLQSCLNAGNTDWYGFTFPTTISPPSGYYQGAEQDGAVFYSQNGTNPPNPCDVSPRHVGTWNGLNVEIRTFPNGKRALVTAVPGSSNDKYYVRGDNFWDNFTKDSGVDQYHDCLNAGITDWFGLTFPGGIYPPAGYQQGTASDGAIYFSTNGLRVAATELIEESVAVVKFHPNPVQEELTLTVHLKEAGDIAVRLMDLQGRVQHKQVFKGIAGTNEQTINISSIVTGIYALEVTLGNQRIIRKVVKQ